MMRLKDIRALGLSHDSQMVVAGFDYRKEIRGLRFSQPIILNGWPTESTMLSFRWEQFSGTMEWSSPGKFRW